MAIKMSTTTMQPCMNERVRETSLEGQVKK